MQQLETRTMWGDLPARHRYVKHPNGSAKLAVLFPGMGYTLDAPLMWYAERASFEAGYDVLAVEYGYQANRLPFKGEHLDALLDEAVAAITQVISGQYSCVVFIGKSLGTTVQTRVAQKVRVPIWGHIFLTPLPRTIPFIQQTPKALVVVGDNDHAFSASDCDQIAHLPNVNLVVIPKADHGLEVEDIAESINILKQVATLCQAFCEEVP